MNIKVLIILMITILSYQSSLSQTETRYQHCDCKEIINYSEKDSLIKNGEYLFTCNNSLTEKGRYKNGKKDGLWLVHNQKGILISKIEYSEGKLNGKYELFFFEGEPKFKGQFENELPSGEWKYFNKKGKITKQGKYENGKPIGIWKVFNKKGKKIIAEYDFNNNKELITSNPKIKKSILPRDDESGEYIIIYFPNRNNLTNNVPFEGSIISNNYFIDLLNVPFVLMNTETQFEYKITAKITEGILKIENINKQNSIKYSNNRVTFPYIAQTNSPKKIKRIQHTDILIEKVKDRIYETLMILGPWKSKSNESFEIHIPFVLNNIN